MRRVNCPSGDVIPAKRVLTVALALASLIPAFASSQETAETYPSKPTTIIVSFAPGGSADAEARLYAANILALFKLAFLVDYKPGAGTTLGTAFVAKSKPDGYTLLEITGSFTVIPALYKDLPFDTTRDFAAVSLMSRQTYVLVASPSFPARSFKEYVTFAKANPGKINFATTGVGGVSHLAGAWLHSATNTQATFVPYKGIAPLMLDLAAGRADVGTAVLLAALPLVKAGKVRALALMGDKRSDLLPGLATIAEQGLADYDYSGWTGFVAPGATPEAIVRKLSDGFSRVAKLPDVVAKLASEGGLAVGSTPEQLRQLITMETVRWRKLVNDTGIKLEE